MDIFQQFLFELQLYWENQWKIFSNYMLYVLLLVLILESIYSIQLLKIDTQSNKEIEKKYVFQKTSLKLIIGIVNNLFALVIISTSIMTLGRSLEQISKQSNKIAISDNQTISSIDKLRLGLKKIFGPLFHKIFPFVVIIVIIYMQVDSGDYFGETIVLCSSISVNFLLELHKSKQITIRQNLKAKFLVSKPKIKALFLIVLVFGSFAGLLCGIYYTQISHADHIYISMRDGTNLCTYIYFPDDMQEGDSRAVYMSRTPYNAESMASEGLINYVCNQLGYILVLQDLRGTYRSEGNFPIFRSDYSDGNDTVDWLRAQPWCNGSIATFGGSAVCTTQYYTHAEGPTGLKAANLLVGAPELYEYWLYPGGCFRQEFNQWWIPAVSSTEEYENILAHPTKDEFWDPVSLSVGERYKNIQVRAVHTGGWFDCFQGGTITGFHYYNHLAQNYAQNHQILIMGPWGHGMDPNHVDISYPDTEGVLLHNTAEKFLLDEALGGKIQDWDAQPRVYYFIMGDPDAVGSTNEFNVWRTSNDWPLAEVHYEPWYLHGNSSFSPSIPISNTTLSYLYDPTNPVQTRGGTTLFTREGSVNGACDQRPVETGREDILMFYSGILSESIEIAGQINSTIQITSNCTDTDFNVKMMDVFPDGREMWIASGILKTRYRNGFSSENVEFMTPGTNYDLNINMWSTAYHFSPGHQIKISITSSDYPKFSANPNTGATIDDEIIEYKIANNSIICGNTFSLSAIQLPRID